MKCDFCDFQNIPKTLIPITVDGQTLIFCSDNNFGKFQINFKFLKFFEIETKQEPRTTININNIYIII